MESEPLALVEIRDLNDPLLLPWLDLYETAFPPSEKVLVSNHLRLLRAKASGEAADQVLIAALQGETLVGMARYDLDREAGALGLWYLAVTAEARSRGLGARIYGELVSRARELGLRALVFEVEHPEETHSPEEGALAVRRIGFYRRQGARLLEGVSYTQQVGSHQPPIPMHVMIHALEEMTPEEAFVLGELVLGDTLVRTGELGLA